MFRFSAFSDVLLASIFLSTVVSKIGHAKELSRNEIGNDIQVEDNGMENGDGFYHGDMLLTSEQNRELYSRKATSSATKYWTSEVNGDGIPVYYGTAVTDQPNKFAAIQDGMKLWEDNTCITFKNMTDPNEPYIKFIDGYGCSSYLGRQFPGQKVSIGTGCDSLSTVAHEIGHTIGFFHEQARNDRDNYIEVLSENIQAGQQGPFNAQSTNNFNIPYDYSSNLHYGQYAFTSNGKPTLRVKGNQLYSPLIQGYEVSFYDIKLANLMYSCIDKWLQACGLTTDPCQNEGYTGKDCNCVCRAGTTGNTCEVVITSYYDALLNKNPELYSEYITEPGTVSDPTFGTSQDAVFTYIIKAPTCYEAELTFTDFDLYNSNLCKQNDRLEIRNNVLVTSGDLYCGQSIVAGQNFTSVGGYIILYGRKKSGKVGWSANLTFVEIPGCPL